MTSTADLSLLSRLLDEGLDLEPDLVEGWLAGLPAEHRHLQPMLREMLVNHRSSRHVGVLAEGPQLAARESDPTVARAGEQVGPYRLIRELGRGGMGSVWLADRADGQLKRQVAIKLPRLTWGAGLARRMAVERDIGALLEHPHIARLYDAGVDELGRPYLAFEYIDGVAVDAWCAAQHLDVSARLRLFLQVAQAVAYAHGRLVVHRDLKPSNVLVTAAGQARLLDFGIAKLINESSLDDEHPTHEQGHVLTPSYASPEQIQGGPITVATDVYSMGVLLYELLTGTRPHTLERKLPLRLPVPFPDEEAPSASSRAPDKITAQALRGDLDAILAKALRRDPAERYVTADAMAQDIQRHLAGERVLAQPDRLALRLARVLRRHRVSVAATAAVLLAVVGGAGVAVVQARRANDAAEQARVVKEFVVDVFKINERGTPGNAELRQLPVELLLERGARLIPTRFEGQPRMQAELYGVVGGIFADMGANESAADYAMRQVDAQAAIGASAPERAQAMMLLSQALLALGRLNDAHLHAQRALAMAGADLQLRPKASVLLARVLLKQGNNAEAVHLLDQAERDLKGQASLAAVSARAKQMRAYLLVAANRFNEALPLYRAAIDEALAAEGPTSPTAIDIRLALANNLVIQNRGTEARPYRQAALDGLRGSGAAGDLRAALEESGTYKVMFLSNQIPFDEARAAIERDRATVQAHGRLVPDRIKASIDFDLGTAYAVWGDIERAAPLVVSSVATLRPSAEDAGQRYLLADVQAVVAMHQGRHDQADAFIGEELETQRQLGAGRHPDRKFEYARQALNLSMQNRFNEAELALTRAPEFEALEGADPTTVVDYRDALPRTLARIKLERGDAAAALALLPAASDDDPAMPFPFDNLLLRGEILCALGRRTAGLALLEQSLEQRQKTDYPHSPHLARERAVAGLCALADGQRDRAAAFAAAARASLADQPNAAAYFRLPSGRLDERLRSSEVSGH